MSRNISIGDNKVVKLSYYRRQPYINIREYVISQDGSFIPTKKGILLTLTEWETLKKVAANIDCTADDHVPSIKPTLAQTETSEESTSRTKEDSTRLKTILPTSKVTTLEANIHPHSGKTSVNPQHSYEPVHPKQSKSRKYMPSKKRIKLSFDDSDEASDV